MKKIFGIILATIALFSLVSCGDDTDTLAGKLSCTDSSDRLISYVFDADGKVVSATATDGDYVNEAGQDDIDEMNSEAIAQGYNNTREYLEAGYTDSDFTCSFK